MLAGVILLGCIVLLLVPIDEVVVPRWALHVVDSTGAPVYAACISESWEDYSVEDEVPHDADGEIDRTGLVVFPERRLRTSRLSHLVGPVRHVAQNPVHFSLGRHAFIVVRGLGLVGEATYDPPPERLPNRIVVRPEPLNEWSRQQIMKNCPATRPRK